jgi:hypothetical protein
LQSRTDFVQNLFLLSQITVSKNGPLSKETFILIRVVSNSLRPSKNPLGYPKVWGLGHFLSDCFHHYLGDYWIKQTTDT